MFGGSPGNYPNPQVVFFVGRPTEFKAAGHLVLPYERSDNDKAIRDFLDRINNK